MITDIVPGIYTSDHRVVEGNNGIISGDRGAVAVDTGYDPSEGQAMVDFIRKMGADPSRVVLTHSHGDHILGSGPFKGAEVFAHVDAVEKIRHHLPGWAQHAEVSVNELSQRIIQPTVTFTNELRLDLGNRQVRLLATPGHSADGVCVFVENDNLLFAGDTVTTCIVPAIGDGNSQELEQSLRTLLVLNIETLVPGHGPPLQGQESVREWLKWLVNYLTGIRSFVLHRLGQGEKAEDIIPAAGFYEFVGDRLSSEQHNNAGRHQKVVAKIIEEVLKK